MDTGEELCVERGLQAKASQVPACQVSATALAHLLGKCCSHCGSKHANNSLPELNEIKRVFILDW